VTKEYLAQGKDGYDVLKRCKVLVDGESCPILPSVVRNHFTELATKNGFNERKRFVSRRGSAVMLENHHHGAGLKIAELNRKAASGQKLAGIRPVVEGRIVQKEQESTKEMEGNEAPTASNDSIVILHFNDVYNIEPRDKEPVGGASRFTTQLRNVGGRDALILFSGDAFNPSMMSTVLKGKQMVPCLNEMNIHTAVLGNHGNHAPTRLISSSHAPFGPSAAVSRTELVLRRYRAAIHAFCLMLSLVGRFRLRARNAGGADALV
jgi:hypothetical protein